MSKINKEKLIETFKKTYPKVLALNMVISTYTFKMERYLAQMKEDGASEDTIYYFRKLYKEQLNSYIMEELKSNT